MPSNWKPAEVGGVIIRGAGFRREAHTPSETTLDLIKFYDPMGDLSAVAAQHSVTQREFLLAAMYVCNFTRSELACRLGCAKKGLDKWLASPEASDFHTMSPMVWKFTAEIMLNSDPWFTRQAGRA
jgi:hypothetical protein